MKHIGKLSTVAAILGVATLVGLALYDTSAGPYRSAARATSLRWTPGDRQLYAIDVESSARVQLLGEKVARRLRLRLAGSLHLQVFARDGDRVHVGLRVAPLRVQVEGEAEEAGVREADGPPFLATFRSDGRMVDFVFPDSATPQLREMLAKIVRTFECVVPANVGSTWTVRGRQAAGSFVAEYTRGSDGQINRTKTRYDAQKATIGVEHSLDRFRLSWTSWLDSASIHERLVVRSGGMAEVRHTTRATLTRVKTLSLGNQLGLDLGRTLAEARAKVRGFQVVSAGGKPPPPPKPPKPTRKDVQSSIRAVNSSDGNDATSIMQLAKKLAADPAHVELVVGMIESGGVTDGTDAALINALGVSGSPEAQNALSGILLDARRRHRNRLRATVALGLVVRPNEEALEGLWQASDGRADRKSIDVSNTALLALGSATGTLSRSGSRLGAANGDRLAARLRGGRGRRETWIVLRALGNTRDLKFADEIAGHLVARDAGEREAAAHALRQMGCDETSDRLATQLLRERDPGVRQAIASSLNRLGGETQRALAVVLTQMEAEADEATRFAMVDLLARNISVLPECRPAMKRMVRREQSKRIRKRLAEALYGGKKQ